MEEVEVWKILQEKQTDQRSTNCTKICQYTHRLTTFWCSSEATPSALTASQQQQQQQQR